MLPADRRGWGLTDDHQKQIELEEHTLITNAMLTRQRNAFAAWKANDVSKSWRKEDEETRKNADKKLKEARKSEKEDSIQAAEDEIERLNHPLRIQYGVGVEAFESSVADTANLDIRLKINEPTGGVFSMVERLSEVEQAAKSARVFFDNAVLAENQRQAIEAGEDDRLAAARRVEEPQWPQEDQRDRTFALELYKAHSKGVVAQAY